MTRIIRASAALLALVSLLGALPAALVHFVGRPWPRPMPAMHTVWDAIRAGDISDTTVIKALAIVVWIAWARLACSIVIEVLARMSGRTAPRVVLLGSAQQWAAALVAAVVLVVGAGPRVAMASGAAGTTRPIAAALLRDHNAPSGPVARHGGQQVERLGRLDRADHVDRVDSARHVDRLESVSHRSQRAQGVGSRRNDVPPRSTPHIVERHESFWSIAEETLGDGSRWREIVELNSGRLVAPGVVFDGTARRLMPGWELLVPDPAGSVDAGSVAAGSQAVAADAGSSVDDAATDGATITPKTVVVDAGDTLSRIAEESLGDAGEWPQLWEANRGHAFGERVFDDPDLILPGWELVLPAAFAPPTAPLAVDVAPVEGAPVEVAAIEGAPVEGAPVEVAAVEVAAVEVAAVEVAPAVPSSPTTTTSPPAPTTTLPPPQAPAGGVSTPPTTTPPTTTPSTTTPPTTTSRVSVPSAVVDVEHAPSSALSGMGAAVLLASGVIGAVGVRRRRQLRSAVIDSRLIPPTSAAVHTEAVLRRLDSAERIARLDIALRAAARELLVVAPNANILGAILAGDGRLDLLLDATAAAAPPPWRAVTDHRWRLPATVDLLDIADSARQANQPCPAMAHLGTTQLDGEPAAEVFLDLEAIGLLSIDGPPEDARSILRAIAAGIAVSPMSEIVHMIVCGLDDVRLGRDTLRSADSLDTALDLAASAIGATAVMTAGGLSTFSLRARHQGGEAWEPAVVIAADAHTSGSEPSTRWADDISDRDLMDLAGGGGRGLAVVIDRPVEGGRWVLRCGDRRWRIEPLGLEVSPVGLSSGDIEEIETLLEEADRPPQLVPLIATRASATDVDDVVAPAPPWSLLIRVLGPVEVISGDGRVAQFERSKALELVVWLSQHRDRSTRTGARTALWEANVRDPTFANVVSDARRNLARLVAPEAGAEWIGRTLTEDLPLHQHVITDADLLEDRLRAARRLGPAAASAVLRPALELVRDMPFSGTSYLWPDTEGIASQLTLLVTSAATLLAGHHLVDDDIDGVFWATGQGLKVLPGHEELIALRMRAHGRRGDLAGVRNEWESYERVLHAEAWSDGEPAQKLVVLRRELLGLR